jgi:hypothetical protein
MGTPVAATPEMVVDEDAEPPPPPPQAERDKSPIIARIEISHPKRSILMMPSLDLRLGKCSLSC